MSVRTLAVAALVGTALVAGAGSAAACPALSVPPAFQAPIKTLELPLQPWRVITPLPLHCEEDEPCWDLTATQVTEIKNRVGQTYSELANEFGVSTATIARLIRGETYQEN